MKSKHLLQRDDALSSVSVRGDGEDRGPICVDDAVLDLCIDAQVLVAGFDLAHRPPHLGWFRHVQLVVFWQREPEDKFNLDITRHWKYALEHVWYISSNEERANWCLHRSVMRGYIFDHWCYLKHRICILEMYDKQKFKLHVGLEGNSLCNFMSLLGNTPKVRSCSESLITCICCTTQRSDDVYVYPH